MVIMCAASATRLPEPVKPGLPDKLQWQPRKLLKGASKNSKF